MAITSLFGASPSEIILARQQEADKNQLLRNQMIAQQGAEFGPFRGLYQAGLRFGDIAGQSIAESLFPQQMDPALKKASDVQNILGEYADKDLNDPAVLKDISSRLRERGYVNESFQLASEANKLALQQEELGIKRTELGLKKDEIATRRRAEERAAKKSEQEELDFFKKNPEQTGPVLQSLALQLAEDPTNTAVLERYTKIAQAGTSGAMAVTAGEEKDQLETDRLKSLIAKNKKDLEKIDKADFDAGTRWNFERQSSIDLLASYGYKPGDKLKGADQLNSELIQAQERAMRQPWQGSATPTARTTPAVTPAATSGVRQPAVVDFNSLPKK